jgi:hypothetical protein
MRGYTQLHAMRKRGQRPSFVSIDVGDNPKWLCDNWHTQGLQAYLLVEPSDPIDRLDLLAVVGLQVHVSGHVDDRERVRKVYDTCVAAGASRVFGGLHTVRAGEHTTVEHFDTAGVLTWQE